MGSEATRAPGGSAGGGATASKQQQATLGESPSRSRPPCAASSLSSASLRSPSPSAPASLSSRAGMARHPTVRLAVPYPSVPFMWLNAARPRLAIGWVVGVLRPFEERAEEIWCRVGIVQLLWANGISLVYLTLCTPLVVSIYINI